MLRRVFPLSRENKHKDWIAIGNLPYNPVGKGDVRAVLHILAITRFTVGGGFVRLPFFTFCQLWGHSGGPVAG